MPDTDQNQQRIKLSVSTYIRLRDRKDDAAKLHKAEVADLERQMSIVETFLRSTASGMGVESFRTLSGTATKHVKTRVQVTNWEGVLAFIIRHQAYQLLHKKVIKDAVMELAAQNGGDIPQELADCLRIEEEEVMQITGPRG